MKAVSPGYRTAAVSLPAYPCSVVPAGIPQDELAILYSLKLIINLLLYQNSKQNSNAHVPPGFLLHVETSVCHLLPQGNKTPLK